MIDQELDTTSGEESQPIQPVAEELDNVPTEGTGSLDESGVAEHTTVVDDGNTEHEGDLDSGVLAEGQDAQETIEVEEHTEAVLATTDGPSDPGVPGEDVIGDEDVGYEPTTPAVSGLQVAPPAEVPEGKLPGSGTPLTPEDIPEGLSILSKGVLHFMFNYAAEMKPTRMLAPREIMRWQGQLHRNLSLLINNLPAEDYNLTMTLALRIWTENSIMGDQHGAYSPYYVARSIAEKGSPLIEEQLRFMVAVINLILLVADPRSRREGLMQVDLGKSMVHGFTDEARHRMIAYLEA